MYNSRVTSCVNITNNGFGSFCINFSSLSGREEGIHCTRVTTLIGLLPSVEGTSLAVCCAPYRQQNSSLVPALRYKCILAFVKPNNTARNVQVYFHYERLMASYAVTGFQPSVCLYIYNVHNQEH